MPLNTALPVVALISEVPEYNFVELNDHPPIVPDVAFTTPVELTENTPPLR